MDPVAILQAVDTLGRIGGYAKKLLDLNAKLRNAELHSLIADLMNDSAELKETLAEIRSENLQLRASIDELQKKVDIRSKMELRNGFYYLIEPVKGYSNGPFCTRCFDCDGRLVTLSGPGWPPGGRQSGPGILRAEDQSVWTCPECIREDR